MVVVFLTLNNDKLQLIILMHLFAYNNFYYYYYSLQCLCTQQTSRSILHAFHSSRRRLPPCVCPLGRTDPSCILVYRVDESAVCRRCTRRQIVSRCAAPFEFCPFSCCLGYMPKSSRTLRSRSNSMTLSNSAKATTVTGCATAFANFNDRRKFP